MPGIRELLRKKEKIKSEGPEHEAIPLPAAAPAEPEFKFFRSTTNTQEEITPPSMPGDLDLPQPSSPKGSRRISGLHFRRTPRSRASSHTPPGAVETTEKSTESRTASEPGNDRGKRLSARLDKLHIGPRSRSTSQSSTHVPEDLPEIKRGGADGGEVEWEERAVLLARKNAQSRDGQEASASTVAGGSDDAYRQALAGDGAGGEGEGGKQADDEADLQEAIRLHEAGGRDTKPLSFHRVRR